MNQIVTVTPNGLNRALDVYVLDKHGLGQDRPLLGLALSELELITKVPLGLEEVLQDDGKGNTKYPVVYTLKNKGNADVQVSEVFKILKWNMERLLELEPSKSDPSKHTSLIISAGTDLYKRVYQNLRDSFKEEDMKAIVDYRSIIV